jgi:antitoxin VapB
MIETRIAKLFKNGASQAVRLPAEFRFEGNEETGDVILSTRPGAKSWRAFFAFMEQVDVPPDFMAERPMNTAPVERDIFGDDE